MAALLHDHVSQTLARLKLRVNRLRVAAHARLHPACDEVSRLLVFLAAREEFKQSPAD